MRDRVEMRKAEIEGMKQKVSCGAVLEKAGFGVDVKESTRRAVKYRRAAEIVIVTHDGRGWFDPLSDDKGDVFSLVERIDHVGFAEALALVGALIGFELREPIWREQRTDRERDLSPSQRWLARRRPWRGSSTWRYLCGGRFIPPDVIREAISADLLREGPCGSMWAQHVDDRGVVCGWEERGPDWRGFSTGGTKTLFRLGPSTALRFCVAEAAIDAMSLAAIEGMREGTLYLSTGGGWSPQTDAALRMLAARSGARLIAATDANTQGDTFAERLRTLAEDVACSWQRLRPPADDWNEVLQKKGEEREGRKRRADLPDACRPRQGKLRPAEPALDPADRDAGDQGGVTED